MIIGVTERPVTLADALVRARDCLVAAGIEDAWREARALARLALKLDMAAMIASPQRALSAEEAAAYVEAVARRARREPFARIAGMQEFWSLPFAVNAHTLIPRADSETVVDAALSRIADRGAPMTLLDLGTGSGCLLLALLSELTNAHGIGVDLSEDALRIARSNAEHLGLADRAGWICGDWCEMIGTAAKFDVIVANPPYVAEADLATLAPEVRSFEPRRALVGGRDGLDAYRAILPMLRGLMKVGGVACLECGDGQTEPIARMLDRAGLSTVAVKTDLAGLPRCVIAAAVPGKPGEEGKKTVGKAGPADYL